MSVTTPTTAIIKIQDRWLEDAQSIQWSEQNNKSPLFGVLDKKYRAISAGRMVVTGTIGIYHEHNSNFLELIKLSKSRGVGTDSDAFYEKVLNYYKEMQRVATDAEALDLYLGMIEDPQNSTESVNKAVEILNGLSLYGSGNSLGGKDNSNASDVDLSTKYQGFNMTVLYNPQGAHKGLSADIFSGVTIYGRTKGFQNAPQMSGAPIMEYYAFFAKSVERRVY